jgi:hypothetical protein
MKMKNLSPLKRIIIGFIIISIICLPAIAISKNDLISQYQTENIKQEIPYGYIGEHTIIPTPISPEDETIADNSIPSWFWEYPFLPSQCCGYIHGSIVTPTPTPTPPIPDVISFPKWADPSILKPFSKPSIPSSPITKPSTWHQSCPPAIPFGPLSIM